MFFSLNLFLKLNILSYSFLFNIIYNMFLLLLLRSYNALLLQAIFEFLIIIFLSQILYVVKDNFFDIIFKSFFQLQVSKFFI